MVVMPDTSLGDRKHAGSPLLTAVLVLGVVVMLASLLALILLLTAYFSAGTAWPPLYALTMFGLPAGFALMFLHVVLSAIRRSRLEHR